MALSFVHLTSALCLTFKAVFVQDDHESTEGYVRDLATIMDAVTSLCNTLPDAIVKVWRHSEEKMVQLKQTVPRSSFCIHCEAPKLQAVKVKTSPVNSTHQGLLADPNWLKLTGSLVVPSSGCAKQW